MAKKRSVGIHALYAADPLAADEQLWGRSGSRRGFLKQSALAAMSSVLGAQMVFADFFPAGLIPAGLAQSDEAFQILGKDPGLIVLNDRPLNAETPAHLLDEKITSSARFFIRNNGLAPSANEIDPSNWQLRIGGEAVRQAKSYTIAALKKRFETVSLQLTLECGGNGRKEFNPPAKGNQWTLGAVGCPLFTGVRLRDILQDVGLLETAVYIGYYGADTHLSGDPSKVAISRGVPIRKALEAETLVAWAMNGAAMPLQNGHPLRLVVGGWPASCSGKWLREIVVRDKEHDGEKMGGQSYRVPAQPVAPGTVVPDENMRIIESMPVKSVITFPKSGASIRLGQALPVRGQAWAGDVAVAAVDYSIDFGASWKSCRLEKAANRFAWQHFNAAISFPQAGYYEVWARAKDTAGLAQPMLLPGWNPRGYLNNACHRIAVKVS